MSTQRQFPIRDIVDLLMIPHRDPVGTSMDCTCPGCGKKNKMNAVIGGPKENIWRCNACGIGGGSMDLYSYVKRNRRYSELSKDEKSELLNDLEQALGIGNDPNLDAKKYTRRRDVIISGATDYVSSQYSTLSDFRLNLFYRKLIDNPHLKLRLRDKQHLLDRGLSEEVIKRNEYRSFLTANVMKSVPSKWLKRYEEENWEKIKNENPVMALLTKEQLLTGLFIGQCLVDEGLGLDPNGLPGAFLFKAPGKSMWGFRLYDGILIPIRNQLGEIVAMQIRTTSGSGSKYMLISSRNMPCGRVGRGRIHYPLANHEGNRCDSKTALLTEGPLKSDVYCHLDPNSSHKVFALVGVNSTSGLAKDLEKNQFTCVFDGFDMDKLVNPAVMKGLGKIRRICKASGVTFQNLFWDLDSVKKLNAEYLTFIHETGVELPPINCSSPVSSLANMRMALYEREIPIPDRLSKWPSQSKGIDDFMFSQRRAAKT